VLMRRFCQHGTLNGQHPHDGVRMTWSRRREEEEEEEDDKEKWCRRLRTWERGSMGAGDSDLPLSSVLPAAEGCGLWEDSVLISRPGEGQPLLEVSGRAAVSRSALLCFPLHVSALSAW
jgi:hypothetical protein